MESFTSQAGTGCLWATAGTWSYRPQSLQGSTFLGEPESLGKVYASSRLEVPEGDRRTFSTDGRITAVVMSVSNGHSSPGFAIITLASAADDSEFWT